MAERMRLTAKAIEALEATATRRIVWDDKLAGFGVRIEPKGRKTYLLRYRAGGGRTGTQRETVLGVFGVLDHDEARKEAKNVLAKVRLGSDPVAERREQRAAPTMVELFDRYMNDHARPTKKPASIAEDERLIRLFLKPAFEKRKVRELTRADVDKFHKGLREKPYRANRALAVLSKALNLAEVWGWRPDGSNPVRHVSKFAEKQRKRFLSPRELAALGTVLIEAERAGALTLPAMPGRREQPERVPVSAQAIAAIRLLILTGARRGEILGLQWDWIDWQLGRANLPDSKTGAKVVILPPPALALLEAIPRQDGNPHVITGGKPGAHLVNLKDPWLAIREAAGLDGVRIHDLRHSFASVAAAGGASLPIIGALLGHSQPSTTARYAHLADDPLRAAAAEIGGRIAAALDPSHGGQVVAMPASGRRATG